MIPSRQTAATRPSSAAGKLPSRTALRLGNSKRSSSPAAESTTAHPIAIESDAWRPATTAKKTSVPKPTCAEEKRHARPGETLRQRSSAESTPEERVANGDEKEIRRQDAEDHRGAIWMTRPAR